MRFAPIADVWGHVPSQIGKLAMWERVAKRPAEARASVASVASWTLPSVPVLCGQEKRANGFEPSTFSLEG